MRKTAIAALAAASVIALAGCKQAGTGGNEAANGSVSAAAASIDGTWKTDLSTMKV